MNLIIWLAALLAMASAAIRIERGLPGEIYTWGEVDEPTSSSASTAPSTIPSAAPFPESAMDKSLHRLGQRKEEPFNSTEEYYVPLPVTRIVCFEEYILDEHDYVQAVENLDYHCEKFEILSGTFYASVVGKSIAYVCAKDDWADHPNSCNWREWEDAESLLDDKCGKLAAGFVYMKDWAKTYGRARAGMQICENMGPGDLARFMVKSVPAWRNMSKPA